MRAPKDFSDCQSRVRFLGSESEALHGRWVADETGTAVLALVVGYPRWCLRRARKALNKE